MIGLSRIAAVRALAYQDNPQEFGALARMATVSDVFITALLR